MPIKPLGKRVLVKKLDPEEKKSAGGIVLPDSAKTEKVVRAEVVAVGTDEKLEVKVGDQIIISDSFSNTEVIEGEEKYLLVKESEILAIVE
ncbi:co-chaperone GroES [Candidatus Bipolaricaulota bacterium]